MKNLMKCLSIIMVMIMLILAACTQENTSNNNDSPQTGVLGKWENTDDGLVIEFKNDGCLYKEDGPKLGEWTGNDNEVTVMISGNQFFNYTISGNNMTWIFHDNNNMRDYYTRM